MEQTEYVPEYCVWELTLKCNMRCIHCGSTAGRARPNELTVDECLPIADELIELGCGHVSLIGGEVFFVPDWQRLARHLSDAGLVVNIITNGFLMGDRQIGEIRDAGLRNVCISLDGMRESHNMIRRVASAWDHAVAAMDRLRSEQIPVAVITSLLGVNVNDLEPMYDLLVEHGVICWQLQTATPMGNLAASRDLVLDPAEIPRITRFIRDRRRATTLWILAGDDIGYFDENEMYLRNRPGTLSAWQGCSAGLRVIGIDSTGNVKGCESLYDDRFIEGNLRNESLAEIWHKEGNFAYNRHFDVGQLTGRCADCDRGAVCRGGCRGSCYFTADGLYENPYCCYPGRPKGEARLPIA